MTLQDWLHEEYETRDGDLVLFRCTECGQTHLSLDKLHEHIEGHRGYTRFDIQIPFTETAARDGAELMARTEVLRVAEVEEIGLEQVVDCEPPIW